MIKLTNIVVRSFELDHLDIFWELTSSVNDVLEEHDFYVLRSIDGAAGPYEQIAGPFYNTFLFRDPAVHLLNKWRKYFYRIKVVHRPTSEEWQSQPASLEAPPDLIALEIIRRESLLLQEFNGRVVLLFPQLTFGQRCRHCWDIGPKDNTIGRAVQQNCQTCFDTTYVGGFAQPMRIFAQIDPSPKSVQPTDLEEHQFVATTGRTTAFPPLKPKDMLVEAENKRWLVEKVTQTQKLRAVVRQELQLRQYSPDNIKHKVPVNFDLLHNFSPAREYTRPMSLQSEQQEEQPISWLGSES